MQEVLVDRGEFRGQNLIERVDDCLTGFDLAHGDSGLNPTRCRGGGYLESLAGLNLLHHAHGCFGRVLFTQHRLEVTHALTTTATGPAGASNPLYGVRTVPDLLADPALVYGFTKTDDHWVASWG